MYAYPEGMRIGLKIAYEGTRFHGFARQPDRRTVEGEVRFALEKAGLLADSNASRVRGASRTDAGVSALGNVVAFDTEATDREVVGRFNDAAKDTWAWAVADLPPAYDPRRARQRWYRYLLVGDHDLAGLRETSNVFVGTHDFASFASPDAERTRRHLDSIEIESAGDGIVIDVRAPSFLRGMVRRIIAALVAVERGDATKVALDDALRSGAGPDLGLAAPEPLVLMDVDLGFPFRPAVDRATRERIGLRLGEAQAGARFWREAARVVASPVPHEAGTATSSLGTRL